MKIGVLGAGGIARSMSATLRGMRANGEDVELWSVGSRDIRKAEQFAKREGFQKACGSYSDMLEDPDLDLVYIATPHALHAEQMLMCLERGKAVLCEKAFTGNAPQAEKVLQTAKEKNILTAEAIWTRYMPSRGMIRDILAADEIGEVTALTANLGYTISGVERIIRPELAGGALLDVGVYCLNFARMFCPVDIVSMEGECVKSATGMDLTNAMTLILADGMLCNLQSSASCVGDNIGVIAGTDGNLIIDNVNNPQKITVNTHDREFVEDIHVPQQITGYEYQFLACRQALIDGLLEPREMPHEETLYIMQLMDTLRQKWGVHYPMD